ncbi:MAG: hypothetical protein ACFE85_08005 [Candidatus Hodarchaeota archaeon]
MYYLPTSLIFFGYAFFTFFYTIRNRKEKLEKHLFVNEILFVLLLLNAGIMYPFIYQFHSPQLFQDTINFLWLLSSLLFLIEMGVLGIILTYNAIISKRDPDIMAERDYKKYCKEFNENWTDDLKSEFGRKMLHLFTCSVIFIFWTIGTIFESLGILESLRLDLYSFSYWWIVTIGFSFVFMFQVADLARLNKFYMLPNWAKKWYHSMRQNELNTFIGSTPLVLSFVPFIFAPFPIFAAVALITTVADAIACLIGKKFGNHNLKKNSEKTIEGFIAGGLSTFLIVIIIMIIYNRWILIQFPRIVLMAIVAAIIFLLIDLFSNNISDNILNPILTGLAIWIIFLI